MNSTSNLLTSALPAFGAVLLLASGAAIAADSHAATNQPARFVQKLNAGQKQLVITYGTSLTAGGHWVTLLNNFLTEKYPGLATVHNSGEGAMASTWGVENLDERVLKFKPDAVIIEFAINDAYTPYNISQKQSRDNLLDMISRIKKVSPQCDIILLTLSLPIRVHFDLRPDFEAYYEGYKEIATSKKLMFIDTYPAWKATLFSDPDRFNTLIPDGIHPGGPGCETISFPIIKSAILGEPPPPLTEKK